MDTKMIYYNHKQGKEKKRYDKFNRNSTLL